MKKLRKLSCIGSIGSSRRAESIPKTETEKLNMAALKDVTSLYQNLKQEWTKTPCNLKKCGELLNQLKVCHSLINDIFLRKCILCELTSLFRLSK